MTTPVALRIVTRTMTDREAPSAAPVHRPPAVLVGRTLLACLGVFVALEFWRPYYFLTDDNLSVGLPFLTEMGRHLKSGQSPFYSDYLYGGHYDLLRDINYFSWNPVNFFASLLADTPLRFAMLDLTSMFNLALAAVGFMLLSTEVRAGLKLAVGDGRLLFLTLSFTFSTFVLTTGASWANFLVNQAVLPWLALGLWQTRWRPALALLLLFSLHQALGGQSAATVSNGMTMTLFAVLMSFYRRSLQPLACWAGANVLMVLLISPLLVPALEGFSHSHRGAGLPLDLLQALAVPAALVPVSFLFGNFFEMAARLAHIPPESFLIFPAAAHAAGLRRVVVPVPRGAGAASVDAAGRRLRGADRRSHGDDYPAGIHHARHAAPAGLSLDALAVPRNPAGALFLSPAACAAAVGRLACAAKPDRGLQPGAVPGAAAFLAGRDAQPAAGRSPLPAQRASRPLLGRDQATTPPPAKPSPP